MADGADVVGITRGGMVIAYDVTNRLYLPLDALVVHKICQTGHPQLGVGVVVETAHLVVNRVNLRAGRLGGAWLNETVRQGAQELRRRGRAIRGGHVCRDLAGRRVI